MAMNPGMAMMMAAQARRRRDERGRYMVGDQGNNQYTRERRNMDGEMRDRPDMRYSRRNEMRMGYAEGAPDMRRPYNRRMEDDDTEMRRRGRTRSEMNDMLELLPKAEMRRNTLVFPFCLSFPF